MQQTALAVLTHFQGAVRVPVRDEGAIKPEVVRMTQFHGDVLCQTGGPLKCGRAGTATLDGGHAKRIAGLPAKCSAVLQSRDGFHQTQNN